MVLSCVPVNLVLLPEIDISGRERNAFFRKSGTRFRSEVPDNSAAGENIVLAALVRSHIELRHTRPEVASFPAQAESTEDLHIDSEACLEYARVRPRWARVMSSEEQGRAL